MKLTDMNLPAKQAGIKTLRENFGMEFDPSRLSKSQTKRYLTQIESMISEAKSTQSVNRETNPTYLKLKVMESVLLAQLREKISEPYPDIIIESDSREYIGKAQTVMAVQDVLDELQGMIVDISDITVKKLPSIVDTAKMQIGGTESNEFNTQATAAMRTLADALTQAKSDMQAALDVLTGQSQPEFDLPDEVPDDDFEEPVPPKMTNPLGRGRR